MPTNQTLATFKPPFAGVISLFTATFYKLNPAGTPIEPLADIIPAVTPNRIAVDIVDSETHTQNYTVTRNTLQSFDTTTPNVHREPTQLSVTGMFSAAGPLLPLGQVPLGPVFRFDLLRMSQLERLAEERKPIAVVSPRIALPYCFIESIQRPWTPADGSSIPVTVNLVEARILSPTVADVVPDTVSLEAGNAAQVAGGASSGAPSSQAIATPAPVQQTPHIMNTIPA